VELDKNIEQELAVLLADPEKVSVEHTSMLHDLLQEYPYYQPLHLLLAKAGQDTGENRALAKASLYTNGQRLHRFLFERRENNTQFQLNEVPAEIGADLQVVSDEQEIYEEISEPLTVSSFEPVSEEIAAAEQPADEASTADEQETFEEISEALPFQTIPPPTEHDIPAEEISAGAEETVFEEIGEVDYNAYRPFKNTVQPETGSEESLETADAELEPAEEWQTEAEPEEDTATDAQKNTLENDFVFESIVSTDFFAFEDNFSVVEEVQEEKPEVVAAPPVIEEHNEAAAEEVANGRVSNYNDDKLPYTFLWWLAKTRKEHQESFQPYVTVKKAGGNELQQQYVEHIFHLQSHLTGSEELLDTAESPKPLSRDSQIIDSFIKNDPQIHPPNAEQIDNENKAKRSAEDQNDLVSETLAGIYIEQMLYDKAIDTYEKLSLKFPEKSRYFADLIQSIEKKI